MVEKLAEIARPADRHADVAHRVLDDQVPPDDPGYELSKRRIRVGVRRSRDRNHGGELGITEGGKAAGQSGEQERDHDGRSGAGPKLVSHNCRSRGGEDARPDGGPNAQRGQVPLVERASKSAAFQDVVFAILDGFPDEEPAHSVLEWVYQPVPRPYSAGRGPVAEMSSELRAALAWKRKGDSGGAWNPGPIRSLGGCKAKGAHDLIELLGVVPVFDGGLDRVPLDSSVDLNPESHIEGHPS